MGRRALLDDRGQVVPLAALVVMIVVAMLIFGVRLAAVVDDAARARTAADAAALAGAADGPDAARDLAAANGGELVSFDRVRRGVVVVVRVGSVTHRARAEREVLWLPPSGGG